MHEDLELIYRQADERTQWNMLWQLIRILVNIYFLYSTNPEEVRSAVLNFPSQLAEWIAAAFDARIDFRRQSLTSVCFKGCCCLAMQREHLILLQIKKGSTLHFNTAEHSSLHDWNIEQQMMQNENAKLLSKLAVNTSVLLVEDVDLVKQLTHK